MLETNSVDKAKKKLKVSHYEGLLLDFGVDKEEFSEERGGKRVRIKAKALANYFWSRDDIVNKYHVYKEGDSEEESYEEIETSSDEDDSQEHPLHVVSQVWHAYIIHETPTCIHTLNTGG